MQWGLQHTNNTQRHSDMSVVHFVMLECFCLRLPNRHPVFEQHVTTLSISDKNNWSLLMSLLYPRTIHLFLCLHLLAVLSINPTHILSLSLSLSVYNGVLVGFLKSVAPIIITGELLHRKTHNKVNPLKTKRRLLYLKTQFVPRSKHFSSRL